MTAIPLANAKFCVNCESITDHSTCPVCAAYVLYPVSNWLNRKDNNALSTILGSADDTRGQVEQRARQTPASEGTEHNADDTGSVPGLQIDVDRQPAPQEVPTVRSEQLQEHPRARVVRRMFRGIPSWGFDAPEGFAYAGNDNSGGEYWAKRYAQLYNEGTTGWGFDPISESPLVEEDNAR